MKECPKCHKTYDDSMNFCISCGSSLDDVSGKVAVESVSNKSHPKKKSTGCLKKVIIGVIALLIGLYALGSYINNAATYLRVEPDQLVSPKGGGMAKVDIDYDGYIWTINYAPAWIDIEENETDFKVIFAPNTSGRNREGSITIQSGKLTTQVAVAQSGVATFVHVSRDNLKFKKSGGSTSVDVETDGCNWEAEYSDFLTVTKNEDGLNISAPRNTGTYRTGMIKVYEDNLYRTIHITQGGTCSNCRGKGELDCAYCLGLGGTGLGWYYSACMWCGGSGKVVCSLCQGTGEIE